MAKEKSELTEEILKTLREKRTKVIERIDLMTLKHLEEVTDVSNELMSIDLQIDVWEDHKKVEKLKAEKINQ
jgi:hypothetical protein